MAVTHTGRDNPSNHLAAGLGPVRIDHGECDALGHADRNDPALTIVAARILSFQRPAFEDLRGELEVEPRSSRLRSLLRASQSKRTTRVYARIYGLAN